MDFHYDGIIETLKPFEDVENAHATNLLEDIQEELPTVDRKRKLTFRPFEIKTVLVER